MRDVVIIECPKCQERFESEVFHSVNITIDPELILSLYERKLNVAKCPNCNSNIRLDITFLFSDMTKNTMMWVDSKDMNGFWNYLKLEGYFNNLGKMDTNLIMDEPTLICSLNKPRKTLLQRLFRKEL